MLKDTIRCAQAEITSLRQENHILRAKVDTMNLLAGLFYANPHANEQGMCVDINWQLQNEIDLLEKAEKEALPATKTTGFSAPGVSAEAPPVGPSNAMLG